MYFSLEDFFFRFRRTAAAVAAVAFGFASGFAETGDGPAMAESDAGQPILLNENSSWCWFQDERAILDGGRLLFSGVDNAGAITVTAYDFETKEAQTSAMNSDRFKADDHNAGALLVRPDGRYLCVYAGHNHERKIRYRISAEPGNPYEWEPEQILDVHARVTYSNVYRLADSGITYNFFRARVNGYPYLPHYMISKDDGSTWEDGGMLFSRDDGIPYVRYTSNNIDQIHFTTTESHPRFHNNNIYHAYIKDGALHTSDGTRIGPLSTEAASEITPADFTLIYEVQGEEAAWTSDIALDKRGRPYMAFSVSKHPIRQENDPEAGMDLRYHYARWDGETWKQQEIAYAGSRLYPAEQDYSGLITLHPGDPDIVYISADVDPVTNEPLLTDGERRYEIFRGNRNPETDTWKWTPITRNSQKDNIRPIIVSEGDRTVVMWLYGRYTTYRDYDLQVWALINP